MIEPLYTMHIGDVEINRYSGHHDDAFAYYKNWLDVRCSFTMIQPSSGSLKYIQSLSSPSIDVTTREGINKYLSSYAGLQQYNDRDKVQSTLESRMNAFINQYQMQIR